MNQDLTRRTWAHYLDFEAMWKALQGLGNQSITPDPEALLRVNTSHGVMTVTEQPSDVLVGTSHIERIWPRIDGC